MKSTSVDSLDKNLSWTSAPQVLLYILLLLLLLLLFYHNRATYLYNHLSTMLNKNYISN
jgi:hypothetical protein